MANSPVSNEGRSVDATKDHVVAPDVHVVERITRLDVELSGRLRDLLHHEVRIEEDRLTVDSLAGLLKQLRRFGLDELHADLGNDAPPPSIEDLDRVGREEFVPGHLVDEHQDLISHEIVARATLPSGPRFTL